MFSEENVIHLISPQEEKTKKNKPLRKSIHNGLCPPSYSTFGLRGTSKPGVQNVGGNTEVESKTNKEGKKEKKQKEKIKPQVPKATERPILGVRSSMNFVKYNSIINQLSRPPQTKAEKNYLKKEEYGEKPKYLDTVKKEIEKEYEFIIGLRNKHQEGTQEFGYLSESERLSLLNALKTKLNEINKEYLNLSFKSYNQTISKEKRKEWCEEQILKIEKFIQNLHAQNIQIIRDI